MSDSFLFLTSRSSQINLSQILFFFSFLGGGGGGGG